MKKLLHILVLLVLALPGCVNPLEEPVVPVPDEEGKVTINGSLSLPMTEDAVWTKSFGEYVSGTSISHLYVVVFNEGDILEEIVEARPGTKEHPTENFEPGDASADYKTLFHVTLTESPARKRILHFIGTSVERRDLLASNIMDESSYVKGLVTSGKEDAYWGRQEFPRIIEETEIHDIPMVRNFVKVNVMTDPSTSNFTISGFKVFNVPTSGTIIPFNPNSPEYTTTAQGTTVNLDRFANYTAPGLTYLNLSGSGSGQQHYEGFMPSAVEYDMLSGLDPGYSANGSTDADFVTAHFLPANGADYLYEATHYQNENNPFIIIKGHYLNHPDTYYKADFVYASGGDKIPYHLLRNFQYTLNIEKVSADGFGTIYEAVNGVALNNFEASTQSQHLINISDGKTRLYLSTTDEMIVSGTTLTMYVKSKKKNGNNWVNDNASISVKSIKRISGEQDIVSSAAAVVIGDADVTYQGENDWRKVTITLKDPATLLPGEVLKQSIVFKNKGDDGQDGTDAQKADDLSRALNLTIRQPMSLTVNVQDYVTAVPGSTCQVDFSIPSGLTEYRFPMYFYIEQQNNTLYPEYLANGDDATLTVMTGKSRIAGQTSNNTYYYRRTLTWDEYRNAPADISGIRTFSSYFRSLVGASATTVWVFPAEENDYFTYYDSVHGVYTNQDSFSNVLAPGEIELERTQVLLSLDAGRNTTVNEATAKSGAEVSYTSNNPSVATVGIHSGVISAVSEGTATITVTCEAGGGYTEAINTFQVTVVAHGGLDIVWQTEPSRVLIPGSSSTGSAVAKVSLGTDTVQMGQTDYQSSNPSVATINGSGVITPISSGTTVITATAVAKIGTIEGFTQDISYTLTVGANGEIAIGTAYHTESFLNGSMGDYTINLVSGTDMGAGKENIWYYESGYGMEASARNGSGGTASSWRVGESWLISKSLDLRATDGAVIRFNHTANYFNIADPNVTQEQILTMMKSCLTLWYRIGDAGTWAQIPIPDDQYPTGTSWVSQDTNIRLPNAVNGQPNVQIAFKYVSTETAHGTWQVKDVTIIEEAGLQETP